MGAKNRSARGKYMYTLIAFAVIKALKIKKKSKAKAKENSNLDEKLDILTLEI